MDRAAAEKRRVHNWRLQRFRELSWKGGAAFTPGEAKLLASSDASWHDAQELLDRGCSPVTAMMILL